MRSPCSWLACLGSMKPTGSTGQRHGLYASQRDSAFARRRRPPAAWSRRACEDHALHVQGVRDPADLTAHVSTPPDLTVGPQLTTSPKPGNVDGAVSSPRSPSTLHYEDHQQEPRCWPRCMVGD